ncbi:hypothetical protein LPA65_15335 [Lactiplantibacillus argentoratensis]|uniref:Uncharacterized protein n=1 Tax=Lactiplantibacillus argentoratensis TaxID=271881 RepID=A0AAN1UJI6_9LACO|nr:hypothetical protein LPA65_15335 [Lactiplantibacillus argentoratensis]
MLKGGRTSSISHSSQDEQHRVVKVTNFVQKSKQNVASKLNLMVNKPKIMTSITMEAGKYGN